MKSERRHELEHNALAVWLDHAIVSSKPHVNKILGISLVVVLLICAMILLNRYSAGKTAESWNNLYGALSVDPMQGEAADLPSKLSALAEVDANSSIGQVAAIAAGDRFLDVGCMLRFENKGKANEELRNAIKSYGLVVNNSSADTSLRQRAMYGQARAYEASCDVDKAVELYERLAKLWPEGTFAKLAQERAADLKKDATKAFYDRFAKYEPKPPVSVLGSKPAFDVNSLRMPKEDTADMKSTFKLDPKSLKPDPDQPAADGEKKAEEVKPEDAKPAETPVEEKKSEEAANPAAPPAATATESK